MIDDRQPVIFCDYDGTATEHDVIEMVLKEFAQPGWEKIVRQILDERSMPLKQGLIKLFHMLPGDKKESMEHYVLEHVKLRTGFERFLTFCETREIPFLIVSGGVDFLIEPVLFPYREKLSIYCNTSRFTPTGIELELPYFDDSCQTCGQCACCKISIMDKFPKNKYYRIVIGDSLTDLASARQADRVFARSRLITYAKEENIDVTPFETFDDIQNAFREISYA